MAKQIKIVLCTAIFILSCIPYAHAAGLKTLMEVGKNQGEIAKSLRAETQSYNKVKDAISSGKLKEGIEADSIRKKYGEPIFDNIFDKKRSAYKWLYMPATSDHFKGEKLYLFVDEAGTLVGWQLLETID